MTLNWLIWNKGGKNENNIERIIDNICDDDAHGRNYLVTGPDIAGKTILDCHSSTTSINKNRD
jgi:hypothetical protein